MQYVGWLAFGFEEATTWGLLNLHLSSVCWPSNHASSSDSFCVSKYSHLTASKTSRGASAMSNKRYLKSQDLK